MGLIKSLQPDDTVHLVKAGSGGLAISVIRGETLLVAAGAVTEVLLGNDLVARYPGELMQAVETLFREADPRFELPEVPIEIRTDEQRRILCGANTELGPYHVFGVHGFYSALSGLAWTDACAAISRVGAFPETVASSCAQLLDGGEFEVVRW